MTQKRLIPVRRPRMLRTVMYSEWLRPSLVVPQNIVTTIPTCNMGRLVMVMEDTLKIQNRRQRYR